MMSVRQMMSQVFHSPSGFSAVLLTDTAFYRNLSYHQPTDTLARLDMRRLGLAVDALMATILAGAY